MKNADTSTGKQVIIFFAVTYLFSWLVFLIGHFTQIVPIIILGVWGPSISSVVLTGLFFGRNGLRQLFSRFKRYHIKWYWWCLLLLLPATVHFTGRSIWQLAYDGAIDPFYRPLQYWASAIIPSFLIAGIGEELGWRGFALPRLQKLFSPVVAMFILAVVHMFWHLPTYWLGQGIHNVPLLFVFCFLFPWTIIFNWLYNRSGGSLIFAVSFHAISNASLSIVRFMPLDSEVPITTDLLTQWSLPSNLAGPYLSVCALYWIVAFLILRYGKFSEVNTDVP